MFNLVALQQVFLVLFQAQQMLRHNNFFVLE
jgi:hypothetical protein